MGTTLRDDNWQLVEIYRDSPLYFFLFFFSLAPCESDGEKVILRPALSRHNILYAPRIHTYIPTRKYTVGALSRHNDRLTRLPHKAGFDLHAGEKSGKRQGKNTEDAERRKKCEEHTGRSSFA